MPYTYILKQSFINANNNVTRLSIDNTVIDNSAGGAVFATTQPHLDAYLNVMLDRYVDGVLDNITEDDADDALAAAFTRLGVSRSLAADLSFTPPTPMVATNVQSAIEEVNAEVVGLDEEVTQLVAGAQGRHGRTGFIADDKPVIEFDDLTRTFRLVAPFSYWIRGELYVAEFDITHQIPDVSGTYYLYITTAGTIITSPSLTGANMYTMCLAAIVGWNADDQKAFYFADERHSIDWSKSEHLYHHATVGARYDQGFDVTVTPDGDGTLDSHAQASVDAGVFYDEDIRHVVGAATQFSIYYRQGADWTSVLAQDYPIRYDGVGPFYNKLDAGVWSQENVPVGKFFLSHVIVTNCLLGSVVAVQGTQSYDSISQATSAAHTELLDLSGLPFAEVIPVASIVYQASATNTPKAKVISLDSGEGYYDWRDPNVNALMTEQYNHIKTLDLISEQQYAIGLISQPEITVDNVAHTVTVGPSSAFLARYSDVSDRSLARILDVPGSVFPTATDQVTYYIKAVRTDNTAVYTISTTNGVPLGGNATDVARVIRTGTTYHTFRFDALALILANKLEYLSRVDAGFKKVSGVTPTVAARVLTLGSGLIRYGGTIKEVLECISDVDNIRFYTWNGTAYTFSSQTLLNNTQYNGPTGLVTMTNGRYNVNWIYRGVEDQKHIYSTLSRAQYNNVTAAVGAVPPVPPDIVNDHAALICGIVYLKDSATHAAVFVPAGGIEYIE